MKYVCLQMIERYMLMSNPLKILILFTFGIAFFASREQILNLKTERERNKKGAY